MLLFVYSVLQGSCLHGEDKLGRREVGREGGRWEEPGKLTSAVRRGDWLEERRGVCVDNDGKTGPN